jgi:hypothetical protein
MPLLDDDQVRHLLDEAAMEFDQFCCENAQAKDYCRTCDEIYYLHVPGCARYESKHHGHRLTIVPFVETR